MSKNRKTRELAMQVLFLWDVHSQPDAALAQQLVNDGTDDESLRRASMEMANAAWEARDTSDQWVERLAPQWPPRRQPGVDRNLLRLAVWELTHRPTPPKVVIDEAIELAKEFSTEQERASFVNGVLDAVLKEHNALIAGVKTVGTEVPPPEETLKNSKFE